jgi:hypothetical protein
MPTIIEESWSEMFQCERKIEAALQQVAGRSLEERGHSKQDVQSSSKDVSISVKIEEHR